MGREKVIHMIQTQSQNEEIRQIEKIAWRKVDGEVGRMVRRKVLHEVWCEVLYEVRRKLFK